MKMQRTPTQQAVQERSGKVAESGEEAVELVIEAMNDNDDLFRNEAADLLYSDT